MKSLKILVFSSLIAASVSSFATPVLQLQPLSGANGGGADFCKQNYSWSATCVPVTNTSQETKLNVDFVEYGADDVVPGWALSLLLTAPVNHVEVRVVNDTTGQQIFDGNANNMEGLSCTETRCVPWT